VSGVLVVGDALLDVDVAGRVERTTPDAGLPVLDVTGEVERPGGAALAAALLAESGVPVTFVTALCADDAGRRLHALLTHGPAHVEVVAGPGAGGTVVKTRLAGLARVDRGDGRPADDFGAAVTASLHAALPGVGAVLVSDYGRGIAAEPAVRAALAAAVRAGVPVVWDPHPRGPVPVPAVTVATPNLAEARAATHDGGPVQVGRAVLRSWSAQAVAVTCGARGAVLVQAGGAAAAVDAPRVSGGDPCGAGDAFAGGLAAALADGLACADAVRHAVHHAARFVGRGGAGAFASRRRALGNDDGVRQWVTGRSASSAFAT
jgi:D-beta-D-heptose 7-phosphate kinase / D-beta-D-heptose 1-phosphate adenosyltransferase